MAKIKKERTRQAQDQQLVNLVVERQQHSEKHFTDIRHRLPAYYELYRGTVRRDKTLSHKHNVHLPIIFSSLQSSVARKVQTSWVGNPMVRMVGTNFDDASIARKREALLDAQFKDADSLIKAYDAYLTSELYGTTIVRYGWDFEIENQLVYGSVPNPMTGESIERIRREEVVLFDGPNWKNVDLLDWFPQPGHREISDMSWVIEREIVDLETIRKWAAEDRISQSSLEKLEKMSLGAGEAEEDLKSFRLNVRTESEETARENEPFSRPVTLLHYWGSIPSELAGEDGITNVHLIVANRTVLLTDPERRANPFFHGQKPYLSYSPMPDPHFHFGPGKVEVVAKLQIIANKIVNQSLDVGELFGDPAFFYNRQTGLDTSNLYMRPGRFIGIDGNPQTDILPIQPDLRGVQLNLSNANLVESMVQRGTGVANDTVQGLPGPDRETARGFLGRQEAASNRLQMEAVLGEKMLLEPLADMFNVMNKQFLTFPKQILILGESATVDPITGERLPQFTREMLTPGDMTPDYAARAEGSTNRLNKATDQQNAILLTQAVSANPIAAAAANWLNWHRWLLAKFDVSNVNELIATAEQQAQQLQAQQRGSGATPVEEPGQAAPGVPNFAGVI